MKPIKQLLITIAVLLCSATANAHDFEVDGIYYNIISASDLTAAVTYKGNFYDEISNEYSGEVIIPETVVYKSKVLKVTSIRDYAFRDCSALTSITIGNSVTSIGNYAFSDCRGLTSVTIGNGVTSIGWYAFSDCRGLTSVTIGNSVTSIGHNAFEKCRALTSITIPNSVTSIRDYAFSDCRGLTSVTIGNSVTSIGESAFRGCSGLTSVTIPNSVTSIAFDAFRDCSALTSITIPNSVTTIGSNAFLGCNNLKEVEINTTNIENWFQSKTSINNVVIGKDVVTIGMNAFYGCTGITSITIPNSVTSIGISAFWGCSGLASITIPNSVTSIGESAFYNCTSLKDLRIEDGETTLRLGYNSGYNYDREGLFYDCPLESLYLGRNIQYATGYDYGFSPFCKNKTLKSVTIGNSVTSIGESAFRDCDSLASIRLLGETPPTVGSNSFTNKQYLNTIVYVPKGTLATYQAADTWKEFWDIREEDTTETPEEEVKKCATPLITYNNSGLDIASETDGSEIHTDITCSDANSYNSDRIDLSATYSITTYATKSGYLNSDTATATLCWIAVSGSSEENSIIEVEAMPVLITCNNGTINIRGGKDGSEVVVYTTSGVAVGNATITNGNASISTELAMGEIVVVNIAGKGIKIVMQ